MDLTAVDFSGIDIQVGDFVTLFGGRNNKLENICSQITNTPYSILTGLGNRITRKYHNV